MEAEGLCTRAGRWGGLPLHVSEGVHRGEILPPKKGLLHNIRHHRSDRGPFTRLSCRRGIQMSLSPPVALDLFGDLDEGCSLGVMSYEVSTSTLNEVVTKLEGNSVAEQGTSVCMRQGRPMSKGSCASLVSGVSCVWLSPRNETHSRSDCALWEGLSAFSSRRH